MRTFKQLMCIHWFDAIVTNEFSKNFGAIICMEQKSYTYTEESRTCSKCGLIDSRIVGEPVYNGWN